MSFEDLAPPVKKTAAGHAEPVRVAVAVRGDHPAQLSLLIRRDLIDGLGKGKSYAVQLGKAEERHLLRIKVAADGLFQAKEPINPQTKKPSGVLRFILPPHERWPACKVKAQGASYTIGKGCIDITLPSWAWEATAKTAVEKRAARTA